VNKNTGGKITSNTGGIDCGSTCSGTFNSGASVQLTAVPDSGYVFTGWSGDASGNANPATVTMSGNKTVTATFAQLYTLTVSKTGNGKILSDTGGINCGTTCSATYPPGTLVTLTATADPDWAFDHWTGATTANGASCTVTMNATKTVSATFIAAGGVKLQNGSDFWLVSAKLNNVELLPTMADSIQCGTTGPKTYSVAPGNVAYHFGYGGWSQDGTTRIEQNYFEGSITVPSGGFTIPVGQDDTFLKLLCNKQTWWSFWSTEHCGVMGELRPLRLIIQNTGAWQLFVWLGSSWSSLASGTISYTPCLFDPMVFKFNDNRSVFKDDAARSIPYIDVTGTTLHALAICDANTLWDYYKDLTRKPADSAHPPYQ